MSMNMLTLAKNLASFNPEGKTISGGPASVCVPAFLFIFFCDTHEGEEQAAAGRGGCVGQNGAGVVSWGEQNKEGKQQEGTAGRQLPAQDTSPLQPITPSAQQLLRFAQFKSWGRNVD